MENWLQIPNLPEYEVSDVGAIRRNGRVLALSRDGGGYPCIKLKIDGKYRTHNVHRVLMATFVGPADGRDVNHINGVRDDNRLENLEYVSRLQNIRHARNVLKSTPVGERRWNAQLDEAKVVEIFRLRAQGLTLSEIGRRIDYHPQNVWRVLTRRIWKHVEIPPDAPPA